VVNDGYFDESVASSYDETRPPASTQPWSGRRWNFFPASLRAAQSSSQGLVSNHYRLVGGQWNRHSIPFCCVWPSELDRMAQMAGIRARERCSGWGRDRFTGESKTLVGVWEKPRAMPWWTYLAQPCHIEGVHAEGEPALAVQMRRDRGLESVADALRFVFRNPGQKRPPT